MKKDEERYYYVSWTQDPKEIEEFCRELYRTNVVGFEIPSGIDGTWVLIVP